MRPPPEDVLMNVPFPHTSMTFDAAETCPTVVRAAVSTTASSATTSRATASRCSPGSVPKARPPPPAPSCEAVVRRRARPPRTSSLRAADAARSFGRTKPATVTTASSVATSVATVPSTAGLNSRSFVTASVARSARSTVAPAPDSDRVRLSVVSAAVPRSARRLSEVVVRFPTFTASAATVPAVISKRTGVTLASLVPPTTTFPSACVPPSTRKRAPARPAFGFRRIPGVLSEVPARSTTSSVPPCSALKKRR